MNYQLLKKQKKDESLASLHEPFLSNLEETFKQIFDDFFLLDKNKMHDVFSNNSKYPKTNITKTKNSVIFEMAVPGCKKEDINVEIIDNCLCISHDKVTENNEKNQNGDIVLNELRRSSWKRAWELPENIDDTKISGSLDSGILKIEIRQKNTEKEKEQKIKKIEIT